MTENLQFEITPPAPENQLELKRCRTAIRTNYFPKFKQKSVPKYDPIQSLKNA